MAKDEGEQGRLVPVAGQDGSNVLVSVPMVGFPEGFELPPGARVMLVNTPSGPAARPLVRATRTTVPREALEGRDELELDDRRAVLQDATVVGEQPQVEGAGDEDVVWLVESGEEKDPDQVIAVRLVNPGGR